MIGTGLRTIFELKRLFIFGSAFLLLVPNFLHIHLVQLPRNGHSWEQFESGLVPQIQSIDQLLVMADSIAIAKKLNLSSLDYVVELNRLVKKRFYHGYSHYSLNENWIAAILGKIVWNDLSAKVLPDDLLKDPMASCSQQSIVLMEALKRKGITYRKIGFDHHFALEAQFGGQWTFFDPDMEPDYSVVARSSIESLFKNKDLYTIYQNRLDSAGVEWGLANPFYGIPNAHPAPRASILHWATKWLSRLAFLLPFLAFWAPSKQKNKTGKKVCDQA